MTTCLSIEAGCFFVIMFSNPCPGDSYHQRRRNILYNLSRNAVQRSQSSLSDFLRCQTHEYHPHDTRMVYDPTALIRQNTIGGGVMSWELGRSALQRQDSFGYNRILRTPYIITLLPGCWCRSPSIIIVPTSFLSPYRNYSIFFYLLHMYMNSLNHVSEACSTAILPR